MKKILSSVLVVIFLNYLAGYYVIFWAMRQQADHTMTRRLINDNYSDNETVTFKFPFTLPYYNDWNSYERIQGSFQYHGEYYKLVKQKLQRDTLYIVAIKDYNVKRISGMASDFMKRTNDMTANSQTIKIIGNFSKDYRPSGNEYLPVRPDLPFLKHRSRKNFHVIFADIEVPKPPPKTSLPVI